MFQMVAKKMIKSREIQIEQKPSTDRQRPKIITWKGIPMVRNHSFLATVQEIVDFNSEIDVCRVGIVGDMHSGKTTLAEAIAHAVHKKAKIPYTVRIFNKEDLLNFRETIHALTPANYVLIFDDVSFLGADANKKTIEMIKQAITQIRHLEGGTNVKILSIQNYHYTLGLDKYLREADFRYFTTVGSSEKENMEKILGHQFNNLVKQFKSLRHQGVTTGIFALRVGPKETFTYKFRNPWIPVLFFNEQKPRLIVTPTRHFMDQICSICSSAQGHASEISIKQFIIETEHKFSPHLVKLVIKQALKENGLNTYGREFTRARRYLDRALETKVISLEELATHYNMTITNTNLRKKLDGILAT